ncbi:alpha/beta fold hydrolase [Piscinibacter sakaiensis]|uniref:Alpha/beta fold hydrolase n=2 Tax=Piscinibacter sakaiensis TaxID=1547922 RepID=A0A0K8P399_PISS1|nr:alpha/beta fold hydrolase [Piscinibacter sakaiensis]
MVRGLGLQLRRWGPPGPGTPERPLLVMLHGWMDVSASFQFMVDAFAAERPVLAPDARGFGGSDAGGADAYWFPDYLGDLDGLLDALAARGEVGERIDLLGHSMGGNVAMLYAGVRPQRIRRLVNLEGFGPPSDPPSAVPGRLARWLDELRAPVALRRFPSREAVAAQLRRTNPRLAPARADWLAGHWARQAPDGRWDILGDPPHKRINPTPHSASDALACWSAVQAPTLWVEGAESPLAQRADGRLRREDVEQRLAAVPRLQRRVLPGAGHMLHHDQPEALAAGVEAFLDGPAPALPA